MEIVSRQTIGKATFKVRQSEELILGADSAQEVDKLSLRVFGGTRKRLGMG